MTRITGCSAMVAAARVQITATRGAQQTRWTGGGRGRGALGRMKIAIAAGSAVICKTVHARVGPARMHLPLP